MSPRAALGLAVLLAGWAQAQEQTPPDPVPAKQSVLPFEVSGFLGFRSLEDDDFDSRHTYREYSGSIFISRKLGRWVFHSEFNLNTAPEYDSEGIHLFPARPSLSVKLDNATVNYNYRDWLQFQGGFQFVPTYWRTHRYQSTTLTVDEPLVDQNVFPTSFAGVMLHGDKYFETGGFSYLLYGGSSNQEEFDHDTQRLLIERTSAIGGKIVAHVPSRRIFDTFDIGYHRLHRLGADGGHDQVYGWELNMEKGRAALLAEFAHAWNHDPRGSREYFQQGYYFQPSCRITPRFFAVARYDWLNRDSRFADENGLARQSAGVTFRPTPGLSLKFEADRYEPQRNRLPAYYGVSAAVVYFFRLP